MKTHVKAKLENEFKVFFNYFRGQLEIIIELGGQSHTYLQAYLLLCTCIDALAGFRYGWRIKTRFINFLLHYSDRNHQETWSKISKYYLDHPLIDVVKGRYQTRMDKRRTRRLRTILYGEKKISDDYRIKEDMTLEDALEKIRGSRFYNTEQGKRKLLSRKAKRRLLLKFSYADYFYHWYRCFGLHSFQIQTGFLSLENPLDSFADLEYEGTLNGNKKRLIINMNFPIESFKACINNFEQEMMAKIGNKQIRSKSHDKYKFVELAYGIKNPYFANFRKYIK